MIKNLFNILIVGIGGFIGAASRYLTSSFIQRLTQNSKFPYGTITVNTLGCLLIGLCAGYADNLGIFSGRVRLFLFVGILGGFTTFSTVNHETLSLIHNQEVSTALLNIGLNVILGLLFVYLGYVFAMRT